MHHVQSSEPTLQYAMLVSTGPATSEYILSVSTAGITNIKNFVVENRASDPADPVTGQIWMIVE